MYWFCGLNDNSEMHKSLYITALKSAYKNTKLTPILLYDGNDIDFQIKVINLNAIIINHRISFHDKPNFIKKEEDWKKTAYGAFLRIDIPIICKQISIEDEYVLYTDTDVIFLNDVVDELKKYNPEYFAICPEFNENDFISFNSGVMLINVNNMYKTYNDFTYFMESNNYNFCAYDQGALQTYYAFKQDKLPIYFNHKTYWNIKENVKIIHYHGPKYDNILNYLNNINEKVDYSGLYSMVNKNVWKYYLELYEYYKDL